MTPNPMKLTNLCVSVLPSVQKHPDLHSKFARHDARECSTATRAGVVLFKYDVVLHVAARLREVFVWGCRRWLTVEMGTVRAGLNPEIHSGVPVQPGLNKLFGVRNRLRARIEDWQLPESLLRMAADPRDNHLRSEPTILFVARSAVDAVVPIPKNGLH